MYKIVFAPEKDCKKIKEEIALIMPVQKMGEGHLKNVNQAQ